MPDDIRTSADQRAILSSSMDFDANLRRRMRRRRETVFTCVAFLFLSLSLLCSAFFILLIRFYRNAAQIRRLISQNDFGMTLNTQKKFT